ncbi:MAG: Inosine-5'-monophosphate dehydrogenase [Methanobacterium sp. PtaU1.Bin242]|nr:MAG: Inosine-5'-monophosphate dehydrogenase [Methanobacterium sp. PtaU1.Bin242]
MIKVKDAMEKNVIKFHADDKISDVAQSLRDNRISGAPIVDENLKIIGIISEGDIMRLLEVHSPRLNLILPSPLDLIELPIRMKYEIDEIAEDMNRAASVLIGEIMTKEVLTVKEDDDISDAAQLMDTHSINRLPVVDDEGKLIGIVTRGDLINALVRI